MLRNQTTQFRDPTIWALLAIFASGIATIVAFILLDGDLITHDYAEGAIEHGAVARSTRGSARRSRRPTPAG